MHQFLCISLVENQGHYSDYGMSRMDMAAYDYILELRRTSHMILHNTAGHS